METIKEYPYYVWATDKQQIPNACQGYRIITPLYWLEKMGYAGCYHDDGTTGREGVTAMLTADIDLFYSIAGEIPLHQIKSIQQMKPVPKPGGGKKYPPLCVYDADDNADFVHPLNFTFAYLGVRAYPSTKLLEPDVELSIDIDLGKGSTRQVAWIDKETKQKQHVFDIARNLHQMKIRHEIIRTCNGATASTEYLAKYFKEVIGQQNVYVFPNTISLDEYEFFNIQRTDDKVRILWQGSPSHYVDWYPLKNAIKEIVDKYRDKITFVIYGEWFDWVHEVIPDEIVEHHSFTSFDVYKLRRALLNIDINLCPLSDNPFNRCKSAVKWYEASIWPAPEATLAANVGPYKEIKDGKTGLLYNDVNDFVNKLSLLIENVELRKKLGIEAKKWVLNNRTPEKTIPGLNDFYTELIERQKREIDPKIIVARA